jgi:hypothetical protein
MAPSLLLVPDEAHGTRMDPPRLWPTPHPGGRKKRYVFAEYSKSYRSSEILPLRKYSVLQVEFYRQIFYRLATIVSDFSHAAIVIITDNDPDDEFPDEDTWTGVYWDWSRRRTRTVAGMVIDPTGAAQISRKKIWRIDKGLASQKNNDRDGVIDLSYETARYDCHGITDLSDEEIYLHSELKVSAELFKYSC